ncbi:ribose/xylose/arabinose/galactoside ABC-type transport system permease subunit [Ensifer sp. KUDG1]
MLQQAQSLFRPHSRLTGFWDGFAFAGHLDVLRASSVRARTPPARSPPPGIAASVIGGTSLTGGVGRVTGTVIGTIIHGVMTSGFTFLRVDAYYQEIVKGLIIVAAVVVDVYRQKNRKKA